MCTKSLVSSHFSSVTVTATETPLLPSPVSAAATVAPMCTVMRWTQVFIPFLF